MSGGSNAEVGESGPNDEYTVRLILLYEKMFGQNYLSFGGQDMIKESASLLQLKAGQKVLDVGGGIGGPAFYLIQHFGVSVVCLDISTAIGVVGRERAREAGFKPEQVVFETADVTVKEYSPESFDVIFSLFTVLYIEDKSALFKQLHKFLKPGGKLLILDYCHSDGKLSESFQTFKKEEIYNLISLESYRKIFTDQTGFVNVKTIDRTLQLIKSFQEKIPKIKEMEGQILQEIKKSDFDKLVKRWTSALGYMEDGYMKVNYFYAEKSN